MLRKKKWIAILVGSVILMALFLYSQNNILVTSEHSIQSKKVPAAFDGYTIVQLSDLHSKSFGDRQSRLVEKVEKAKPDLIVFTGDVIDSRRYNEEPSLILMEELVKIAPVYYVTGNHEWHSGKFAQLETALTDIGVHVMRNTVELLTNGNESIQLIGIDDPANAEGQSERDAVEKRIQEAISNQKNDDHFQILLSHRPELFTLYSEYGIDLVFSGHAHGGQFRFPFIGGLIAPHQGLLPEYTAGVYEAEQTKMIVNRGLGNSLFPFRLFNLPEIVVVKLGSVE
ncbi:metallophosphoesterase [Bacillus sp. YZJH907-2]|uniref:Metallophosphoesterase n=2 Tax=Halalkalibacter suaedae TaxID=2822140 RepID=A0A940WRC5_9BACI|nr:metallophosphoesterase [Bacillus suaedae]